MEIVCFNAITQQEFLLARKSFTIKLRARKFPSGWNTRNKLNFYRYLHCYAFDGHALPTNYSFILVILLMPNNPHPRL